MYYCYGFLDIITSIPVFFVKGFVLLLLFSAFSSSASASIRSASILSYYLYLAVFVSSLAGHSPTLCN